MRTLRGGSRGGTNGRRPRVSVVLPVLDEATGIDATLRALCLEAPDEVVVVDGGSQDATLSRADGHRDAFTRAGSALRLIDSPAGRARQMNTGAKAASGEVLLFLHADTRLPRGGVDQIRVAVDRGAEGGWFGLTLDVPDARAWLVAKLASMRSRLVRVATGDMALFVSRPVFGRLGGFPDVPLMEDVLFSRRLARHARLMFLPQPVSTSARRWEQAGYARTILRMWALRLLHFLGASPESLARFYPPVR